MANKKRSTITLAVTGHRNIAENDKDLVKRVTSECRKLKSENPDAEYIILTGMAEGADRLVAKVAVKELKAKLIPVLAVPEESYMMDFSTPASKKSFRALLKKSAYVITAPLLSKEAWREYTTSRNHQYAWEGAFIAQHADVLLAIWDGEPARGIGGTAHVVRWFKKGKVPKRYQGRSEELADSAGIPDGDKLREFIHIKV